MIKHFIKFGGSGKQKLFRTTLSINFDLIVVIEIWLPILTLDMVKLLLLVQSSQVRRHNRSGKSARDIL